MFYSTQILAKKGPLGTVWIASHLDRRLKRSQVFETNLTNTVDNILNPEAPLALRLSGQLLLGVVKIYSRKVAFLFDDCNDALIKVTKAFKIPDVDLPADGMIAPVAAITLPDDYNEIDPFNTAGGFTFDLTPGASAEIEAPEYYGGKRDSLLMLDEFSSFAGSHPISFEDERFEVAGEEMERHMSMSYEQPERLREAAPPPAAGPLFSRAESFGPSTPFEAPAGGDDHGDDELMVVPPDDMDFGSAPVTRPPSEAPVTRPPSEAGAPLNAPEAAATPLEKILPELSVPRVAALELRPTTPRASPARTRRPAPAASRLSAALGIKKRRVKLDMDGSRAATELAGDAIRALLQNPAPLLRTRVRMSLPALHAQLPLPARHVARYNQDAADSTLHRPGISELMPPALFELYSRNMAGAAPLRRKKRAAKQAAGKDDEAARTVLVVAEDAAEAFSPAVENADSRPAGADGDAAKPEDFAVPEDHFDDVDMPPHEGPGTSPGTPGRDVQGMDDGVDMHIDAISPDMANVVANGHAAADFDQDLAEEGEDDRLEEGQEDELGEDGEDPTEPAKAAVAERTKKVLTKLQTSFLGDGTKGRKRKKAGGDPSALLCETVSLDGIVAGRSRVDASRWFFEMLVLRTRNYVEVEQPSPYGDITIRPRPALLQGTAV